MSDLHLLDPRLEADTLPLGETSLCHLRMSLDSRWPWILLIPKREGASELHDLSPDDLRTLIAEISTVSDSLKASTQCLKINVAALGNVVRQLHVHIVAREEVDAAWPGPIWGFGSAERRSDSSLPDFALAVQQALGVHQTVG